MYLGIFHHWFMAHEQQSNITGVKADRNSVQSVCRSRLSHDHVTQSIAFVYNASLTFHRNDI